MAVYNFPETESVASQDNLHLIITMLLLLCVRLVASCVRLFAAPWTVAYQVPLSMGILQARIQEWVTMPSSRESSQLGD